MLRIAGWPARTAAVVAVGILAFWPPPYKWPPSPVVLAVKIAAFAVALVLMLLWALADHSAAARARYAFLLPYLLGAITVICGATSVSVAPRAGQLAALSVVAVIAAGSETSPAAGWAVAGLGMVTIVSAGLADGAGVGKVTAYPGGLLLGFLFGLNLRAHRVHAEQSAALLARAEQLREEQAQVAMLDERARIAREIHDVLAHSLGALGLQIEFARAVLTDRHDEARAVELLDQAHRMAADGLAETRRAVHALRGETLPLPGGLARLGAGHQRRHGVLVTFKAAGQPRPLAPDAELAITRTAQEALVNTAKHAPHQPVGIRLDYSGAATTLIVTSRLAANGQNGRDGSGHGTGLATVDGGYGLTGMRERLRLLGGTLTAGRQGGDWVVVAEVPQ
jgi:signal transduction histidine kinase